MQTNMLLEKKEEICICVPHKSFFIETFSNLTVMWNQMQPYSFAALCYKKLE